MAFSIASLFDSLGDFKILSTDCSARKDNDNKLAIANTFDLCFPKHFRANNLEQPPDFKLDFLQHDLISEKTF